jgi:hypothetical protein
MGRKKMALRAASKNGPRAVLTGWGGEAVPEPGENTGWEWRRLVSLLRELMRSGASGRWRRVSSPLATRQAENSSKNARDSLLTLQPIGRRRCRRKACGGIQWHQPMLRRLSGYAGISSRHVRGRLDIHTVGVRAPMGNTASRYAAHHGS